MLKKLTIKNYALIEELEFIPNQAMNTITGETGAGKSIMLGAIGLLLGNRADTKTLSNEDEKCIIEGHFDVSGLGIRSILEEHDLDFEDITVIRREITPAGKSRSFVNDTPARLEALKALGARLIDVHSQHETLLLKGNDFQLQLVDTYAETENEQIAYKQTYKEWKTTTKELNQLKASVAEANKELDYNQFLLNELEEIQLDADELGAAEEELQLLENAEEIKSKLEEATNLLSENEYAAQEQLHAAAAALSKAAGMAAHYEGLAERLESVLQEAKDIANEVLHEAANVEFNEERSSELRDRINQLNGLLQKHHVSNVPQLIEIRDDLRNQVKGTLDLDGRISELECHAEKLEKQLNQLGEELREKRISIFPELSSKMTLQLKELGMPEAQIEFHAEEVPPAFHGMDQVTLLFSANKGVPPRELSKVASGGETSRIMFVTKHILAEKEQLPTLIFDEIDTGISGEVAIKMGQLMKSMASNVQLITITHLPQVAGLGTSHFFVYKDSAGERTISKMKMLSSEERVQSLAEMIGGEHPSDSAFESARELLSAGG